MSDIINGEVDKMGILYERYKIPVYSYFYKLTCGDREASEDLVHTVFYRALRYKYSFTGEGSFAKWLFRIARNAGLDHNKKKRNSSGYDNYTIQSMYDLSYEPDYEKKEDLEVLDQAIKKLDHEEREIILLGKIECLKYREIAEILGTTEGNIRIRMFRALKSLKNLFENIEMTRYEKARSKRKTD
jgi:RNA polymerase sigma factor (sigma-70 family)